MSKRGHGTTRVAIIGSGNIGTDLMIKVMRTSDSLEMGAMVGIDQTSEGLARAQRMGVPVTAHGVEGLLSMEGFEQIEIIFDATSAKAHVANAKLLQPLGKRMIDMTPAAIGPFVVPSVNLDEHLGALNVNMVTCGGQATIPIVAAVNAVSPVVYGEIVASISSRSAGPGTRANIDEFTETTSHAIEEVEALAGARPSLSSTRRSHQCSCATPSIASSRTGTPARSPPRSRRRLTRFESTCQGTV